MSQLIPVRLDDATIIYIEATEDVNVPPISEEELADEEEEIISDKAGKITDVQVQMLQNFQAVQGTIIAYTIYTLNAFEKMAKCSSTSSCIANVDKVTLEFGIELGGEAGVPYVTKGTAKSNLKITVECSFPNTTEQLDVNGKGKAAENLT